MFTTDYQHITQNEKSLRFLAPKLSLVIFIARIRKLNTKKFILADFINNSSFALLTSGKLKGVKGSYRGFSAARGVKGHYLCFSLFEESDLFSRG